jgi:hypothetical protein
MTIPDMTENVLDTTVHEPPTTSEIDLLIFALERSRAQFAWKCGGLDAAALSKPYPPTVMTLGGLVKHLALVEDRCTAYGLTGEPLGPKWDEGDFDHPASAARSARSGHPPILRRILIDMHQEYARHVGHADLLREAADGLTGANPPQP